MDVIISAKKMDLTDALKGYVEERMERISKYSDRDFSAEVHLSVEKHRHHIHASLKMNNNQLDSDAEDPASMYKAIDLCVDKLEKQVRKQKNDHHGRKVAKEEMRQQTLV